jgi:DNA processing protein
MKTIKLRLNDSAYPELLRNIPKAPKTIYALGNLELLSDQIRLSVVGSRKVTAYGRQITTQLTNEVASQGIVIVSGLALGVDALSHRAALEVGGYTIAVMASGLDQVHPATNRELARQILTKNGCIVSEYPEGTPPLRPNFIARNRIVSGLSQGLLITESAEKSGTLHTANFALEQGRTVMAIPGNITSPLSVGTNNLIKSGATPITNSKDIITALGLEATGSTSEVLAANEEEAIIIKLLQQGITDGAELLLSSKLDAPAFNQTLTMLEITGKIRSLGAGHWSLQ